MNTHNTMSMDLESFEKDLEPQQLKRKRSSILKPPPEKRTSRDLRVSFNDRYIYKELHQDGTCDITNLFLGQDMDLTAMEIVEPVLATNDRTLDASVDMSLDRMGSVIDIQPDNETNCLTEERMIDTTTTSTLLNTTTDETPVFESSGINITSYGDECSLNETYFGAFHDSNEISRISEVDSLAHNVESLQACIDKVDRSRKQLDDEIDNLLKFYKHIVNKDNKYEFAIKIFGLRYGLWLILNVNPDTYPNETIGLKFAVNKRDRHLYPFPEFARAVKQFTKEGREGYLTRFVINAQKFRRFLRQYRERKH